MTRNLTLNLGLRWELYLPPVESDGIQATLTMGSGTVATPLKSVSITGLSADLASFVHITGNFGFRQSGTDIEASANQVAATMTAGTFFAIWLGQLITEQGIGQGISIIIFGGIVSAIPQRIAQLAATNAGALLLFLAVTLATIVLIVYINEGQRRIPVQYAKRVRGTKMYGGGSTFIPLRVNSAGMIPLIFAVSILIFPGVIAAYLQSSSVDWLRNVATGTVALFDQRGWFYPLIYFVMVVAFTYFYTYIVFQQQNLPETLQQQGGFVPGIRPGPTTARYLNGVLFRITIIGALTLGLVAVLPFIERTESQTLILTSTGLLIVVGVVLDTMKQLEAQLLMRHYEGFIK